MTEQPADAPRLGGRLLTAGVVQLVAVVALGVLGPIAPLYRVADLSVQEALGWGTIVIGPVVPTFFGIELVLLAGGVVSVLVGLVLPAAPRADSWVRTAIGVAGALLLIICVPCAVFFSLLFTTSWYSVLPSVSDGGCRIVVREFGFLRAGGGSVGVVRPGSAVAEWVEDYWADDGYAPFSAGDYDLRWTGEQARLRLGVKGTDGVSMADDGVIDCR
ncbi:hypothetical protein GSU68_03435 [Rathayibacter sp. VKM Ac-2759]|uniref:hypothetical protein n=1 Tax=Rathayibacter sp. VKM Ac-2759 TaxID=2609252 RepID=UPI00131850EC|nr:hypothetical protein [Rathayibacter sp. VKM Ac-2759]QHC65730.1 hypothetical protein GSU68_03435 [Rathayibacter sp. VKM Ac-2759]